MIYRKSTKEIIAESLVELAEKKAIDKISVKEIADNAGVSTVTFYNHFQDKYDLLAWIYNYQAEEIVDDILDADGSYYDVILESLLFLKQEIHFYENALKNTYGQNSFFVTTEERNVELCRKVVQSNLGEDISPEIEFDIIFFIKGYWACMETWVLQEAPVSAEELAEYICNAAPEKLKGYLGLS